jgi:hypothetical protein
LFPPVLLRRRKFIIPSGDRRTRDRERIAGPKSALGR